MDKMIQKFVDRFMAKKPEMEAKFSEKHPEQYLEIVKVVIEAIHDPDEYGDIDPTRIHEIDDGDYQGTLCDSRQQLSACRLLVC